MLTVALFMTSNALLLCAAFAHITGRMAGYQFSGIAAVACIPAIVAATLEGITTVASGFAALGAVNAWIWWHGGGGDDTKRRLRSWAGRFQGVRRTAPQGA